MVVVVLIGGAAAVALTLYKKAEQWPAEDFESALFSVKQQAGVVGALAAVVFAILASLQHGKQAVMQAASSSPVPVFGTHRGGPPGPGPSSAVPQAA